MVVGSPPTVRRRQLGRELRAIRERSGLLAEQVAVELRCSTSRVSRIETARVRITPGTVHELLDIYGVEGPDRQRLVALARQAQETGWWQEYSERLTWEYSTLIALENDAAELRWFEPSVLPGLVQTEEYARTVIRKTLPGHSAETIEEKVGVRMARQRVLTRDTDPVRLWAVLDEAVLRRLVGGPDLMRRQLRHLVELSTLSTVRLQVLPFARGASACITGPFTVLTFPETADADVAYVENEAGDLYVEKPAGVDRYNLVFDDLRADALGCDDSRAFIAEVADGLS
ncbi:helix-turn-helix domain-containing protein [Micromonospora sp. NBC_01813]|uniref:helix-turn-helix domain-containing protein n=1 Tax=Micromonospora sp. NBC_01813 TaxID=2975988 RepID=UPI002DDB30BF|nr:helix-turn-helix transcriptional regulator [Micromonospora sp. NBC_01813]WSA08437.1 helix-turn-helix domain-containing protein [Micromonospora sp. NBC_01813]